jgi:monovalent cation:H+ antiporter, CPA1 family
MPLSEVVLVVMGLLTVAMLAAGLCRNLPIPYTVFLVIIGMVLGGMARQIPEMELLLEFQLTPEIVLFIFLPALIFESAFNLNARQLLKDLAPVLTLAIPALLISTAIIGVSLWLVLGIDLMIALLFGALISATDPVAVIALFKELGAPERLTILVEGESLLNDATAIVVFKIILGLVITGSFAWSEAGFAIIEFFRVFLGGALIGFIIGFAISELFYRFFTGLSAFMIMSIVVAYASFSIAESHHIHVSGVMAVVASAITIGVLWVTRISQAHTHVVKETWEVIALVSNSLLFLLVGLSVDIGEILAKIDIIAIAVVFILFARAAAVYSLVPATIRLFSLPYVTLGERHIMWWGGLKGGLAIAIVFSIPVDVPEKPFLLDLTLGVVMFSLLINAPTIRPLIQKLGIDKLTDDELAELRTGLLHAGEKSSAILKRFYSNGLVSRSTEQLIQTKTNNVFASDAPTIAREQDVRQLFLTALRTESDELKRLHEIGLIPHYTYLDIRNNIQRDRERILAGTGPGDSSDFTEKTSIISRLENAFLKRIREHDWAAWILSRYQNTRMAHRMQRDIAGVLVCTAVLEMLETHTELDAEQREQVAEKYKERLQRRKGRLDKIAEEFPDFYVRFETNLFTQVSLTAARHHAEEAFHEGEIGAKVLNQIEQKIHSAILTLPPISDAAPRLQISDLIGTVPLLNGLPAEVLKKLAEHANLVTFLAGDIVIGEGERGDALYIITHGVVVVIKDNTVVAELRDGDFFGEMALLGDQVRTATVKTKTPSTLLRLRRRNVIRLADNYVELKIRLNEIKQEREAQTGLIGTIPLLRGLPTNVLELVYEKTLAVRHMPGDIVIQEGDRDDSLYIIIHGTVIVSRGGEVVAELTDGNFFGEMALLGNQVRTATVKIKEPTTLLKLRRKEILQISGDNDELKQRLEEAKRSRQYNNA